MGRLLSIPVIVSELTLKLCETLKKLITKDNDWTNNHFENYLLSIESENGNHGQYYQTLYFHENVDFDWQIIGLAEVFNTCSIDQQEMLNDKQKSTDFITASIHK